VNRRVLDNLEICMSRLLSSVNIVTVSTEAMIEWFIVVSKAWVALDCRRCSKKILGGMTLVRRMQWM